MHSESLLRHPFDSGTIQRLRFTLRESAQEKFQQHGAFGIGMLDRIEQFSNHDLDAQFFTKLAPEALLEGFARFAFATGEFPQAAEMRGGVALGDEQLTGAEDEAGADFNDLVAHQRPMLL